MSEKLVTTQTGHVLGTHSWVGGFTSLQCPRHPKDDDAAQARALWLEKHVSPERGFEFLEDWLAQSQ